MDIKKLLLEGCAIRMPYKERKEEWVGEVSIHIYAGGFGISPGIIIDGGLGYQKYELDLMDSAIEHFSKTVMCEKNLMYKRNMAMTEMSRRNPEIDLENPEDFRLVENLRRKLIEAEIIT